MYADSCLTKYGGAKMNRDQFNQMVRCEHEAGDDDQDRHAPEPLMNRFVLLLIYLACLRASHQPPSEESVLRLLIVVVGLVLVVVALIAAGAANQVGNILAHWPILP
ncbi:MAG: hypothetical protein BroJett011_41940 [Chloroflexota bacterium]|nr:MAG: hypothetical protein BroJett011_41940 [Chloroflexota bacterium]